MAALEEDFLVGDDLDVILAMLEEDSPEEDQNFVADVNSIVEELSDVPPATGFACQFCKKICKSRRGLSRHMNTKHPADTPPEMLPKRRPSAYERLPIALFQQFVANSDLKLSQDACYSTKTCQQYVDYKLSYNAACDTFDFLTDLIYNFKGNAEKFYPQFYKINSEYKMFPNLTKRASVILGCEVANLVLAHLCNAEVKENHVDFSSNNNTFTKKENSIIRYLAGYVISTVYRRLRRSKSTLSQLGSQSLDLKLAGKSSSENDDSEIFIKARDRGGLWYVTDEIFQIFVNVESVFRQTTSAVSRNIDSKAMVSTLLTNTSVLCNFSKLMSSCSVEISKEVGMNLLDHIMTLYIRVRTFSYVKDHLDKLSSKRKKTRSLRTEIKQSSSSLDHGH